MKSSEWLVYKDDTKSYMKLLSKRLYFGQAMKENSQWLFYKGYTKWEGFYIGQSCGENSQWLVYKD